MYSDANKRDWVPLKRVLAPEELGDWMFMGHRPAPDEGEVLQTYKHVISRRYLNLRLNGEEISAFRFVAGTGTYVAQSLVEALRYARAF
jgi:hypothetical protein